MALQCPRCNQVNSLQKVTAVYSAGLSQGNINANTASLGFSRGTGWMTTGGKVSGTTTTQTVISAKLSPPQKPQSSNNVLKVLMVLGGFIGVPLFFFSSHFTAIIYSYWQFFTVWLLATSAFVYCAFFRFNWYQKEVQSNQAKLAQYQAAIECWDRLYYCHTDDIVIDFANQDSPEFVSVGQMMSFLYTR